MKVIEIFDSIDGEGPRQGHPATFIRLSGCNLRCNYCDTTYSYEGGTDMTVEEVVGKVCHAQNITLTGGEPLLDPDTPELLDALEGMGCDVIIETNGSIDLRPFLGHANTRFVMDWKAPSSGMNGRMLQYNLGCLTEKDEIKFVVSNRDDMAHAYAVLKYTSAQPVISPVFGRITPKEIAEYILEAKDSRVRLQIQLHKIVWPPETRGV